MCVCVTSRFGVVCLCGHGGMAIHIHERTVFPVSANTDKALAVPLSKLTGIVCGGCTARLVQTASPLLCLLGLAFLTISPIVACDKAVIR